MQLKNYILIGLILLMNLSLSAQKACLLGNIKEKGSVHALNGASVYIEGTSQGCASNNKGEYLLKKLKNWSIHIGRFLFWL